MAVGTVTKYNSLEKALFSSANRQWDDAAAGNIMFVLAGAAYTPSPAHATAANLTNVIVAGEGAPIAATGLSIDSASVPGSTFYTSANANFGAVVTITAKYLIAIQPVTPGVYDAATAKLLFYVDLDTTGPAATVSSTASEFLVYAPANGWFKTV